MGKKYYMVDFLALGEWKDYFISDVLLDAIDLCRIKSESEYDTRIVDMTTEEIIFTITGDIETNYGRQFHCKYSRRLETLWVYRICDDAMMFSIPQDALEGDSILDLILDGNFTEEDLAEWVLDNCSEILADMELI